MCSRSVFGLLTCVGPGLQEVTLLFPEWKPGLVAFRNVPQHGSKLVTHTVAILRSTEEVLQGFLILCVLKSFHVLLSFFFPFIF